MFLAPLLIILSGSSLAGFSIWHLVSIRNRSCSKRRRLAESFVLTITCLVAVMVVASCCIDAAAFHDLTPPGAMYNVAGRQMRIDCEGVGSPTLVLDAGLGNDAIIWRRVQPDLAKITRVCSYDRAGYGWSDPTSTPRDADHIAAELHGLLLAAGIRDPLVLMGHSIAGLYIRDYTIRYPEGVVGLVFVDASNPSSNLSPSFAIDQNSGSQGSLNDRLERAAFVVGLSHLFGACPGSFPGYRMGLVMPRLEGLCHERFEAYMGERDNFDQSGTEAGRKHFFAGIPILILSRDTSDEVWNQGQEALKTLSAQSRRIIAKNSGHYLQVDRPKFVSEQVRLFMQQLQER